MFKRTIQHKIAPEIRVFLWKVKIYNKYHRFIEKIIVSNFQSRQIQFLVAG